MSFNLDDPLAGILSDESDDSFFDDDVIGKKKPLKKKETPTETKKKTLFDLDPPEKAKTDIDKPLFDFEEKKVTTAAAKTEIKADVLKSPSPSTFRRTLSKDSFKISKENSVPVTKTDLSKSPAKTQYSTSADKLDILEEINIERKKDTNKLLTKGKSSQSLLDDILGSSLTKSGSGQATRPTTASKSKEFQFDSILGKSEPKETLQSSKQNITLPKTTPDIKKSSADFSKKENDAKIPKKGDDWLGIFKQNDEDDTDTMPAWLGGGDAKKKTDADKSHKKDAVKEVHEEKNYNKTTEKYPKEQEPIANPKVEEAIKPVIPTAMQISKDTQDINTDGTALYLQQQESQLMFALQLKAQEEKVAAMQMRQKEAQRLQKETELAHQSQLELMLSRQAEHRRQMQAIISAHQDRITERIKALLGNTSDVDKNYEEEDVEGLENTTTKRESPYMREKKQLLQLVQSLQENHDKEIDLMETSYRRQLAFMEISSNQAEERMKEETEKLLKFYYEKISWLEEHHQAYKKLTEENLSSLTERHKAENEMLRKQHLESVRVLQEHHVALMENVKNAVNQEQILIKNSTEFSSDLQELIRDVKQNNNQCKDLVQRVENITESSRRDEDRSLQTRERQISDMIIQLKKERENLDIEKIESREVVKMLEGRLKQMTSMIEDETASLKQKKMEFEFEKATFSKQTEFAKNVLKKQEEEIKILKEEIQKEYREKNAKIEEEKTKAIKDSATLAKEKVSISNIKLDLEKMKAELQAQLEETTEERSKLSMEKQQLHIEEQKIIAKSRDIDLLAKTAIEKQSQADKKYAEAELLQKKYEERIRRIQEHVVSLNTREKQIAKEKVVLSRERLNLHNERRQVENKQHCSLCRTQNVPYEYEYNIPETFLKVPVSKDYSAKPNGLINIEQEIAEINLRQSYRNVNLDTARVDFEASDRMRNDPPPVDSGVFKDYMDPKFLMMRLDVQQVIHNLELSKRMDEEATNKRNNEEEK